MFGFRFASFNRMLYQHWHRAQWAHTMESASGLSRFCFNRRSRTHPVHDIKGIFHRCYCTKRFKMYFHFSISSFCVTLFLRTERVSMWTGRSRCINAIVVMHVDENDSEQASKVLSIEWSALKTFFFIKSNLNSIFSFKSFFLRFIFFSVQFLCFPFYSRHFSMLRRQITLVRYIYLFGSLLLVTRPHTRSSPYFHADWIENIYFNRFPSFISRLAVRFIGNRWMLCAEISRKQVQNIVDSF